MARFFVYPSLDSPEAVEGTTISEVSDQIAQMRSLIRVFDGRTSLIVGFERLFGRIPNIWLATKNVLFSLLMYIIITPYGRVKKSVKPLFIFWIIFLLDLELNFIDKLLVFRWELIVLLLLEICFFFVMREIS